MIQENNYIHLNKLLEWVKRLMSICGEEDLQAKFAKIDTNKN
jgi:hypothetical protein